MFKVITFLTALAFGVVSFIDIVYVFDNYKITDKPDTCETVFYVNFVLSILTFLVSLFMGLFLVFKFICSCFTDVKLEFTLLRAIIFFGYIFAHIYNIYLLSDQYNCYELFNVEKYSIAYASLFGFIALSGLTYKLCCNNKKRVNDYDEIE